MCRLSLFRRSGTERREPSDRTLAAQLAADGVRRGVGKGGSDLDDGEGEGVRRRRWSGEMGRGRPCEKGWAGGRGSTSFMPLSVASGRGARSKAAWSGPVVERNNAMSLKWEGVWWRGR